MNERDRGRGRGERERERDRDRDREKGGWNSATGKGSSYIVTLFTHAHRDLVTKKSKVSSLNIAPTAPLFMRAICTVHRHSVRSSSVSISTGTTDTTG